MFNKMISIFKPKKIKDFNPSGLNMYTFNAGFKKKDKDLLLVIFNIKNKKTFVRECFLDHTRLPT